MGPPPRAQHRAEPHRAPAALQCPGWAGGGTDGGIYGDSQGWRLLTCWLLSPYLLLLQLPVVDSLVARTGLGSSHGPWCTSWGVGCCQPVPPSPHPFSPPLSPAGQDLVPEQTFQVQEDHEAGLECTRWGAAPTHLLLLVVPLLPQHPPTMGHPCAWQRAPAAPQQLHQQLWSLVPASPAGLHVSWAHDVTPLRLQLQEGQQGGGTCR